MTAPNETPSGVASAPNETRVDALKPGDMIDLEADPYADPDHDKPEFEFEYATVAAIEREAPDCVLVWIEGVDAFGFPPDHRVKLVGYDSGYDE